MNDIDLIAREYDERNDRLGLFKEEVEVIEEVVEEVEEEIVEEVEVKEPLPQRFTQEFLFSNAGEPIVIDLNNMPEPALPIRVVKEEIQKSYDRGIEDGQIQAKATFQTEIEKYNEWLRRIEGVTEQILKEHEEQQKKMEQSIISISLMVAEHILGREADKNAHLVLEQVRKAIDTLEGEPVYRINVHPDTVKILEETKSTLLANSEQANRILIVADSSVDLGGCVIETSAGTIDGRIKAQLEMLKAPLEKTVEELHKQNTKELISDIESEEIERIKQSEKAEMDEMRAIWGDNLDSLEIEDLNDETTQTQDSENSNSDVTSEFDLKIGEEILPKSGFNIESGGYLDEANEDFDLEKDMEEFRKQNQDDVDLSDLEGFDFDDNSNQKDDDQKDDDFNLDDFIFSEW